MYNKNIKLNDNDIYYIILPISFFLYLYIYVFGKMFTMVFLISINVKLNYELFI